MGTIIDEVFKQEQKIYLDYNGTTPLAPEVAEGITVSLKEDWANPSTKHKFGQYVRSRIETARFHLANLVGGDPQEIIFTSGGTESNNMVILGLCQKGGKSPCHVITTNVEHDSVAFPLRHLKEIRAIEVTEVDCSNYSSIASQVLAAVKENTVLVTIMAANNETGVLMPLREIGQRLKEVNRSREKRRLGRIIFHSDGAQIIGKEVVKVKDLNLDCFSIVGHKFYGPRIGALWTRVPIPPLLFGGGSSQRPGTENTPMIVGLGIAAALVNANLDVYRETMETSIRHLENRLGSLPVAAKINCYEMPRLVNTLNVSFRLPEPFTGKDLLDRCHYILAGTGAACHSDISTGSVILLNSGVKANEAATSIRISIGRHSTFFEMEECIQDLSQAISSMLWENLDKNTL